MICSSNVQGGSLPLACLRQQKRYLKKDLPRQDAPSRFQKMSAQLQSLLRRGQAFLQSTSSGTDATRSTKGTFTTAPKGTLFPKVDPSVDGEDCEHDCESCTVRYPAKWSIDEDEELYGHVKGWATHLVVATGKTDWTRDVEDERGSVMEAVVKCGVTPNNGVGGDDILRIRR